MPKTLAAADADAAPTEVYELTLDEFCTRASATGASVEMLAGFYSAETRKGTVKATQAAFEAALEAFAKAPA